MTDCKEKDELFNAFFAKQCSFIKNSSKLPSHLHYLTDNCLFSVSFSQDDIAKIIQNLDPNKAHGHDNVSIRMLKICGSSIYKPLEMIFKQCIETGVFVKLFADDTSLFYAVYVTQTSAKISLKI